MLRWSKLVSLKWVDFAYWWHLIVFFSSGSWGLWEEEKLRVKIYDSWKILFCILRTEEILLFAAACEGQGSHPSTRWLIIFYEEPFCKNKINYRNRGVLPFLWYVALCFFSFSPENLELSNFREELPHPLGHRHDGLGKKKVLINRPGVAGAVLQTHLLLIN